MTWVTFDDGAPKHDKLIAAGASACWLWACGLAHCYRHNSEDGFIPETTVHSKALYPGLGKKEADSLVKVGLWKRADGGYLIHDYLEWKERRLAGFKVLLGRAGGSVSSEAKRQAALDREARKRIAQQTTTGSTTSHGAEAQRDTTVATTTTSPTATGFLDPSGISEVLSSPVPDPELPENFSFPARPRPRPTLIAARVEARDYEPLPEHWGYAVSLRLTQSEYDSALRDLRDKFGGKKHDEPWFDDKLSAFLEQIAKSKQAGPRRAAGRETDAERRLREQLERVEMHEAAERAGAQGAAQ